MSSRINIRVWLRLVFVTYLSTMLHKLLTFDLAHKKKLRNLMHNTQPHLYLVIIASMLRWQFPSTYWVPVMFYP